MERMCRRTDRPSRLGVSTRMNPSSSDKTAHLFIAGTGRAGTSFLVELLGACGLDVGDLSSMAYFGTANAGYEHRPGDARAPYVIKNPGLQTYLPALDLTAVTVDFIVIPVRDLRAAASSRILQERAAAGWSLDNSSQFCTVSTTAGGAMTSLSVDDQERLLAVGLARVIQWAVSHDVPLILVDFPRIVDDAEYCIDRLWPTLAPFTTRGAAREAHARVARPEKVNLRSVAAQEDPVELRLRIAALEKAIAYLHETGAGPMTSLKTLLALEMRLAAAQKTLRRIAKHLGLAVSED